MRHATAGHGAASDAERPLTTRGHDDAAEAGRWLARTGFRADHAVVSSAQRARETWAALAEGAGWEVEAEVEPGLYSAGPESAIDLLRLAPPRVRALVVVGHNPTVATVASMLDDGEGAPELVVEMAGGYPSGALTVFSYDGEWADLGVGRATPVAFHVGRA
jgi:phosphohistidine phosphatase